MFKRVYQVDTLEEVLAYKRIKDEARPNKMIEGSIHCSQQGKIHPCMSQFHYSSILFHISLLIWDQIERLGKNSGAEVFIPDKISPEEKDSKTVTRKPSSLIKCHRKRGIIKSWRESSCFQPNIMWAENCEKETLISNQILWFKMKLKS